MRLRSYSELRQIDNFRDRFRYLSLKGQVGEETFGFDRYMNQQFYHSAQWKNLRTRIIVRDNGLDLGSLDHEISGNIYIHHLNPMTVSDITDFDPMILDPDNLVSTCHRTHNAIHYGDERLLPRPLIERRPGDTRLW
jgi:hypothetical protein